MASAGGTEVPKYRELPPSQMPGAPHAWNVFGSDDRMGRLNLLTPDALLTATKEVQRGDTFNVTLPLSLPSPRYPKARGDYVHHIVEHRPGVQDDYLDNFYLQGSTQWDALRHIGTDGDVYYGGAIAADPRSSASDLGIQSWAERGIIGRGVLVDVERHERSLGRPFDRTAATVVTVGMLEATLAAQGTVLARGDIFMLRTGFMEAYLADSPEERDRYMTARTAPGLESSSEMAEFLWDHGVAAIAADNPAVEVFPRQVPDESLHIRLIPLLGFALGEFFDFTTLAEDSARDGRYTSFFAAVPLNVPGGVGSPGNAVAIK